MFENVKTAEIKQPELLKPYVGENGIYIPSPIDPTRVYQMLISRELFIEAYNKWIVGEKKRTSYDWDDCEWMNDD